MIDRNLDRLLTETARGVVYPPAPNLSLRVLAAIREPAPRRSLATRQAFVGLVAVALLVLAALAISPSRDAIARLFGVEGSKIEFLPTPLPGETPSPYPITAGTAQPGGVVTEIALDDIPDKAGFEPALPGVANERLGSTIVFYAGQPVVMHHYGDFDLWQTQLRQDAGFGKGVPEGGVVEEVEVGGVPGVWLTGAEHYVYYYTDTGFTVSDSQRLVERSTLVWRTDAFFYRIETDLALEEALRIAETLP